MRFLNRQDRQTQRDVHRAEVLLARLRGFTPEEAAEALSNHALLLDVSLHAAALGLLGTFPSEPLIEDAHGDARDPGPAAT